VLNGYSQAYSNKTAARNHTYAMAPTYEYRKLYTIWIIDYKNKGLSLIGVSLFLILC